jgi:hypothetical protein
VNDTDAEAIGRTIDQLLRFELRSNLTPEIDDAAVVGLLPPERLAGQMS